MQRTSRVSPKFQEQEISWIVTEEDIHVSGGVFLYLHRDLNEPCIYDFWFETIEQAEKQAFESWGISKGDWEDQQS